jgi:hypothetical protein
MADGAERFIARSVTQNFCRCSTLEESLMSTKKELVDALSDFKTARDALVHADDDDFVHHLKLFVKQLDRNPLCPKVLDELPPFDVNIWLSAQMRGREHRHDVLDSLDLPDSKDEQLAIYLDFIRSFASEDRAQMNAEGFGRLFGKHKRSDALGVAQSLVIRPFAEELSRRIREAMAMSNPDVRDLAGVPLSRIPADNEIGVFLSHKSVNKELVRRFYRVLQVAGYRPWIDEEEVNPGDVLHRVLDSGMENSCASVFFVTPDFQDDRWLGQEVDLAINRKVNRAEKFQIITLVFGGAEVPQVLRKYVHHQVDNELDGVRAIIRALPIELGPPRWRNRVVAETKGA